MAYKNISNRSDHSICHVIKKGGDYLIIHITLSHGCRSFVMREETNLLETNHFFFVFSKEIRFSTTLPAFLSVLSVAWRWGLAAPRANFTNGMSAHH